MYTFTHTLKTAKHTHILALTSTCTLLAALYTLKHYFMVIRVQIQDSQSHTHIYSHTHTKTNIYIVNHMKIYTLT